MLKFHFPLAARACMLLLLGGCAASTTLPEGRALAPLSQQEGAYVAPGTLDYSLVADEFRGAHGCTMEYETYRPTAGAGEVMVFLAPGFLRSLKSMRGWAMHWSSHGVAVTVVSPCNSSAFAGHHDRNAADIAALADELHDGPRLYAGFSAGGLAALLAAASDPQSIGYLGLDAVDNKELALAARAQADYPSLLLIAEPAACNASNNMLAAAARMPRIDVLRITHSTHCHFEYPYDAKCEIACGSVRPEASQDILIDSVRSIATAWILEVVSNDAGVRDKDQLSKTLFDIWEDRVERVRRDMGTVY